jgi:hypothetical protein
MLDDSGGPEERKSLVAKGQVGIGHPAVSIDGRAWVVLVGVMEKVSDAAASAFRDLPGAFSGADTKVFAAFAEVFPGADRMQGDEVSSALRSVARGPARTFADVVAGGGGVD